ncbi:NFACT RNA binding domain-containing protein [Spirochaetia bacterium 38H-sp]|uniref:NFACT RNA binding domain-containing protein n=1 Tax=Rarispira pelagica TaxID=3141764 RepID=A0ABU9U8C7_9SPIR
MSYNWREIDYALYSLDIRGSIIREIWQPDFKHLVMELYKPGQAINLIIRTDSTGTAIYPATKKIKKQKKPQRFVQFLRAHIRGARIKSIYQLSRERIIRIETHSSQENNILWIRLWASNPNIIVTDLEKNIKECMFRRPGREEMPGKKYSQPDNIARIYKDDTGGFHLRNPELTDNPTEWFKKIEENLSGEEEKKLEDRLREKIAANTEAELTELENRIKNLKSSIKEAENADRLKLYGDLITSEIYRINRGDRYLDTTDYHGNDIRIELDPSLNAHENAEKYYREYHKQTERKKRNLEQLESAEKKRKELAELLISLPGKELEELRKLERQQTKKEQENKKTDSKIPGLQVIINDYIVTIGRNSRESDEILRKYARGNDYWLHVRDWPGGHVFIRPAKTKDVPQHVIMKAAQLAVHFSKANREKRVDLYCTQVKYLRRAKHGTLGTVIPTREKNIVIERDEALVDRILGGREA